MKKITKEEYDLLLSSSRGKTGDVRSLILELQVNEGIHLEKEDWKSAQHPANNLASLCKKLNIKLKVNKLHGDKGWKILRIS